LKGKTDKQKAAMKKALTLGMQRGLNRIETSLSQALDRAMESSTWTWTSRTTIRQNGSTAGSPRDIVDTGKLKGSKKLKTRFLQSGGSVAIEYNSPYARLVHFGGVITPYGRKGRALVTLPARPWITATLEGGYGIEKFGADEILNQAIQEAWQAQFG
jgi:phage gpG-like protein